MSGVAGYFIISAVFEELIDTGHIEQRGEFYGEPAFGLTELGLHTITALESNAPYSFKQKFYKAMTGND